MKAVQLKLVLISLIFHIGCAKFDLLTQSLLSSNNGLNIITPTPQFLAQPSEVVIISGTCLAGADLNIQGPAMIGGLNILCDSAGTFSQSITLVNNGENLPIIVRQTDSSSGEIVESTDQVSLTTHCALPAMASCSLSGSGRSDIDPYIIGNDASCLQEMRAGLSCYYRLSADIDATATSTWNGGLGWEAVGDSITPFSGQLNGAGFTIENLSINRPLETEIGIFGSVEDDLVLNPTKSIITNLNLDSPSVRGVDDVAVLAHSYTTARVTNVNITNALLEAVNNAGIIGRIGTSSFFDNINITGATVNAFRTSAGNIRSVSGFMSIVDFETRVSNVNFDVDLNIASTLASSSIIEIGGFAGAVSTAADLDNINVDINMNTSGHAGSISNVGGFIGEHEGHATNVTGSIVTNFETSTSAITGIIQIGGFIGSMSGPTVFGPIGFNDVIINNLEMNFDATTGLSRIGGVIGFTLVNSAISRSSFEGSITVNNSAEVEQIGGFIGRSPIGSISDSFVNIDIDTSGAASTVEAGGFVGRHTSPLPLTNVASFGTLNFSAGSEQGGLIGQRVDAGGTGSCLDTYYDSDKAGALSGVGNGTQTSVTGVTTLNSYLQATYVNWDFVNTWQINNGVSIPSLR